MFGLDAGTVLAFLGAGIVLNLTPGADVMFATASGISNGPRAGVAAAFGVALGGVFHTLLAGLGLSAVLLAFPWAYDLIRFAGGGYLLVLAVKAWRASGRMALPEDIGNAVWRGFVTNALNPKVALFILALLPQFTRPEAGPVAAQILFLGGLFSCTGFVVTAAYGASAGVLGARLVRQTRWLHRISAVVYAALALRLVWR